MLAQNEIFCLFQRFIFILYFCNLRVYTFKDAKLLKIELGGSCVVFFRVLIFAKEKDWLIDWMVFYAAFNSISVISRRQLTLFMLSWVSPVLGWALKCLAQGHSHEKTQRIQCGSNPGPLDYESNTLPLSHAGPPKKKNESFKNIGVTRGAWASVSLHRPDFSVTVKRSF